VARAKEKLTSKPLRELKEFCSKKKLVVCGTKGEVVKRLLGHAKKILKTKMVQAGLISEGTAHRHGRKHARKQETQARAEARERKKKVYSAVSKLRRHAGAKTVDALKVLLRGYGLKVSGTKDEQVERVVERQREDGEVEKILAGRSSLARKQVLSSMDAAALVKECAKAKDVLKDGLFKQMMLDRLFLSEAKRAASEN
jgi:hypothetical protein